jgi:hypothetical protein
MMGIRGCAIIGANTILHLFEGTAMIGADTFTTAPFWQMSRLLDSTCEQL